MSKAIVKVDGEYFHKKHELYLPPTNNGNICGARCSEEPHYICTREKGHEKGTSVDAPYHAAHGHYYDRMFAIWFGDGDDDE